MNKQIDTDGAAKLALVARERLDALVHGRNVYSHIVLLGKLELASGALERTLARVHLPKVLLNVALGVAADMRGKARATKRERHTKSESENKGGQFLLSIRTCDNRNSRRQTACSRDRIACA